MPKPKTILEEYLTQEKDPELHKKRIAYGNSIKAIELGWKYAAETFAQVQAKDMTSYARLLTSRIKEDLDAATEIIYGSTKTS